MSIKTVETTYEIPPVPARTGVKKTFVCETCKAQFEDEGNAKKHFAREHSYTEIASLSGSLGDPEELPTNIRGEQMYKFETREGFEAFLGERASREWGGPGWYVLSTGFTRCGRCSSSHCGHNWKSLTMLSEYERNLTSYAVEVSDRLRSARTLLGMWKCPECGGFDEHEPGCVEGQLKDEEDLRQVHVHDCSGNYEEIIDGQCVGCRSAPEKSETLLVPFTRVK